MHHRLLPALALTAFVSAQVTITAASPGNLVRIMEPWRQSLVAMPDGSLLAMVFESDGTVTGQNLRLYRSYDSGTSWLGIADTPTIADGRGAIAAGTDCQTLHATWYALDTGAFANLYHQAFDLVTATWIGAPTVLLAGTNANDQYYATDIAITSRGAIGVAFHTHRTPTTAGLTAWSGGLLVKRPSDPSFQGPFRWNTDTYGLNASMHAIGETLHATFRTNTGGYGIRYRAFDTTTLAFATAADVPVYALQATNSSVLTADGDGNLYALFSRGGSAAGSGELQLGYAAAGNYGTWTTQLVTSDPDLLGGNTTHTHFALARGEGNTVFALYSKRTLEQHQNLWLTIFANGQPVSPEVQILAGAGPDQFATLNGMRDSHDHNDLLAVAGGLPASAAGGIAVFLPAASMARTVAFGSPCQGALPTTPSLRSTSLPRGGSTYGVQARGLPAGAFGLLAAGTSCQMPPVPLDGFGLTGCLLLTDIAGTIGFFADAAGEATFALSLASNPVYASIPIHFTALALAPGANPGGAVISNTLMTFVR
ncbi:MAG: hypothetical protein IPK26_13735 [Planctomycetes bacterium]|nr:hypothetical protein [Planctomycetota bacterium]